MELDSANSMHPLIDGEGEPADEEEEVDPIGDGTQVQGMVASQAEPSVSAAPKTALQAPPSAPILESLPESGAPSASAPAASSATRPSALAAPKTALQTPPSAPILESLPESGAPSASAPAASSATRPSVSAAPKAAPQTPPSAPSRLPPPPLGKGDTNLVKALRSGEVKVFILKLEDLPQPFLSDKSLRKMFVDIVMKDLLKYAKAQEAKIGGTILSADGTVIPQLKRCGGPLVRYIILNENGEIVIWAWITGESADAFRPLFRFLQV
uniref:Uncharacterized protein n=1 Tax=Chromera velia CCMP2878 TaxID=1169474 RepID=A0A0G4I718_9ALVE|eukprot:Cvel_11554.t1-p1 / transcript=Cvel_11554.t1 / gene=Cvel_11554 / organism=Chromera_velia_CCMP2878 / gene_product=hypothetical protein / transcript_product=hypothetical protein / location=Cvel_scaffold730:7988-11923(+) / protein_length=268 / sequence_SO=supercontig / SO=protein_coding / is_pseudo=false